ncbi:hypothetical protein ACIQ4Z_23810 [Peribacillus asahii]|uniref:hypothetical protein n=1 Tax=Peribacillus asahii TaxID=228899 RepID=UPI0037F8EDE6
MSRRSNYSKKEERNIFGILYRLVNLKDHGRANKIEGTSNNGNASVESLELYYKLAGKLVDHREVVSDAEVNKSVRESLKTSCKEDWTN